jgi:hypothetical protein
MGDMESLIEKVQHIVQIKGGCTLKELLNDDALLGYSEDLPAIVESMARNRQVTQIWCSLEGKRRMVLLPLGTRLADVAAKLKNQTLTARTA